MNWLPIGLLLVSLAALTLDNKPRAGSALILHGSGVPSFAFVDTRGRAIMVNPGSSYFADFAVFEGLRYMGAMSVDLALVCTPWPRHGIEGLPRLEQKMPLRRVFTPLSAATADGLLQEIDNRYLSRQFESERSWAVEMVQKNAEFNLYYAGKRVSSEVEALSGALDFPVGLKLDLVRLLSAPPSRTKMSLPGFAVLAEFGGCRWLSISEANVESLELLAENNPGLKCEVLLLPDSRPRREEEHRRMAAAARHLFEPKLIIVCGFGAATAAEPAPEPLFFEDYPGLTILHTSFDGAVVARPRPAGVRLTATRTGRELFLARAWAQR